MATRQRHVVGRLVRSRHVRGLAAYAAAALAAGLPAVGRGDLRPAPAALIPPEGTHIDNDVLRIGVSARDAGAVNSLVYRGTELVNDHDHGRQLQVAWSYNGLGEAYNPTEAGSAPDGVGPTSSSRLLEVRARGRTLTTRSHPAYWRPPGYARGKGGAASTQPVSADTLEKTLTLGYRDDPHVVVVDSAITVSPVPTGPAVESVVVESPAFYVPGFMTESEVLDRVDGRSVRNPSKSAEESKDPQQVLVVSSADGRFAVALVAPEAGNFMSYNCRYIGREGTAEGGLAKITLHYRQKARAGDRLTYRTFVVVGDLATVKASIAKIGRAQ